MTDQLKQLSEAAALERSLKAMAYHIEVVGVCDEVDQETCEKAAELLTTLETQLTEAKAREAVAYEVAAVHFDPEPYIEDTEGESIARRIRALTPDHTITALEQIKQEADKAGFERGIREAATKAFLAADVDARPLAIRTAILATLSEPKENSDG